MNLVERFIAEHIVGSSLLSPQSAGQVTHYRVDCDYCSFKSNAPVIADTLPRVNSGRTRMNFNRRRFNCRGNLQQQQK